MPNRLTGKLAGALLAFAATLVMTGAAANFHACPQHEGGARGADAAQADSHAHHTAEEHDASTDHQNAPAHGCSCVGMGCASGAVELVAHRAEVGGVLEVGSEADIPAASSRRAVHPPHTLPFSVGPPAVA